MAPRWSLPRERERELADGGVDPVVTVGCGRILQMAKQLDKVTREAIDHVASMPMDRLVRKGREVMGLRPDAYVVTDFEIGLVGHLAEVVSTELAIRALNEMLREKT
ncbi:MAG: hypothetical protein AAF196_07640 [Planctomycetota bacterium]